MGCGFLTDSGHKLCKPKRAGECGSGQETAEKIESSEGDRSRIKHWP